MKLNAAPTKTYALIVGIDKYGDRGLDVNSGAPVKDALKFAEWLTEGGVPPENIQLCLSPVKDNQQLVNKCQFTIESATSQYLFNFIENTLSKKSGDLLYIFWAGHGLLTLEGKRRLICANATKQNMYSLDVDSLLLLLASQKNSRQPKFNFPHQICLIDACANYNSQMQTNLDVEKFSHAPRSTEIQQCVLFATREGETAKVNRDDKTGYFSHTVLNVLAQEPDFPPDMNAVFQKVKQQVVNLDKQQQPTYLLYQSLDGDREQYYPGISSAPENLPRSGIIKFVGREEVLKELHQKLQQTERVAITAIAGMGGVGKTELALQYAQEHWLQKTYPGGVCWFRVQQDIDIGTQIVNFARENIDLRPPDDLDLLGQVKHCWRNWKEGHVLIVFDDVNEYKQIKPYLPPTTDKRFKVLVTTRKQVLGDTFELLPLGVLSEEAALDLLVSFVGEQRINREIEQAKLLCKELGFLPLGLELAGRYLWRDSYYAKQDLSLQKYRERLAKKQLAHDSMQEPSEEMTAQRGVQAAFELSWQELNQEKEAQELGYLLSLFALAPIKWDLVEKCLSDRDSEDLEKLRNKFLVDFSLLESIGGKTYQLHQLIREFLIGKENQIGNGDELKRSFCQTMVAVAQNIPDDPILQKITEVTPAIPHLAEAATKLKNLLSDEDLTWPFTGLGRFYEGQGAYEQALPWREQGLSTAKERFGEEHPSVATSLNNLAELYYSQGRYDKAEPLLVDALAMKKRLLGEEHPDVATSLNNLAELYRSQGRYDKAEPLLVDALAMRKRLLGEEHPSVASSLNNLAGRYDKAEPMLVDALAMTKRLLGEEHPSVAISLNNLAGLYKSQGRYDKAEPLYVDALAMRKRLLGEEHPDVASSLNNLAGLYESLGRYDKAEPLLVDALAMRKRLLGEEHPSVATSLNNLAYLYSTLRRYDKAEPLFVDALAIAEIHLGINHPDTVILREILQLLRDRGATRFGEVW